MGADFLMERIQTIVSQVCSSADTLEENDHSIVKESENSITIRDNRTGETINVPIVEGTIPATVLAKLQLRSYDPGYFNTSPAHSAITFIDGDNGVLSYRGYPIEVLAERSNFLEVGYLLIYGDLPTRIQFQDWKDKVMSHTYLHPNLTQIMQNFRYDAHPMGMFISSIAAMGTFYPDANPALQGNDVFNDTKMRNKQIVRLIGKVSTIAACSYRHRVGRPFNQPDSSLGYTENFLYMLDRLQEISYRPNPRLARALDIMFILHADHELNCSTAAMRHIGSALTDPYTSLAGAAAALYGPLHGGANEAVLRMLEQIGTKDKIPEFLEGVKNKTRKLMGFGHRIYKNYDPRAKIIRAIAYEVFSIMGEEPLIEVAVELEAQARKDSYFVDRKLYPNVDFYSGLIYRAMGFPPDMFPVLFAIPRTVGWLAHWNEQLNDPETKIARPRQIYNGPKNREYIPMDKRSNTMDPEVPIYSSRLAMRRSVGSST